MKFRWMVLTIAATVWGAPTFYKDVVPVLQSRCQECHRASEVAPMSLMNYSEVRPWAKAIKEAVLTKKMPPWFADPHFGTFSNNRSLSQDEIDTMAAWVDEGAPEGNPKDAPKPRVFTEGWRIGQPDLVFQMPEAVNVPAAGVVDYRYVVIPTGFTEDKWVQFAEARPDARSAIHHIIAFVRPPGSRWMSDAKPGVPFSEKWGGHQVLNRANLEDNLPGELLVAYAPGLPPTQCKQGEAKLVKAGSDIVLQLHYTPNGKATTDRSKVGLTFAKGPVQKRVVTMAAANIFLRIPPRDANYEVRAHQTLGEDAHLVSMTPHMHWRGKDFLYTAVYPTGEKQVLLSVPHYDFNWQLSYDEQNEVLLRKGTRIECTAHYDNSANNPANPDPSKEVRWGDQTWEEMMIGWFEVAFDAKTDVTQRERSE